MTETKQREKQLFEELIDLTEEADRAAFLDRHCANEPDLRGRLEELLACQEPAETLLGPLPTESADEFEAYDAARPKGAEVMIGRYRIIKKIGSGGCGVVYLAEQQEPVRRQVALKVIRLGMDTENVIARFERERQALAIMDHPNIARVLDAGTTESGRPYFVMELVQGIRITKYCAEHRLTTEQRLKLFILVCYALQHAHQKGIIHRDIKPSNILVSMQDGQPVPKVIDFGIAKAVEARHGEKVGLTYQLHLIGTPAYMSPEQSDLGNPDLDTRSDIYSLGVLLHELLTDRTPFDARELESVGLEKMRRIITEREALRPSTVLAALPPEELRAAALSRRTDPARLLATVKGDLDWIVATALEKDRRLRYETAFGLAADIRRYLANELVVARPPSRVYRLRKLVRRNRVVFMAGALVLATLVAALATSTWLLIREREAVREQARLLAQADARERISQAAVLLSHDKMEEADALVAEIPRELFRPSLECAQVLRTLGEWHALAGRWSASANRHFALASVISRADASDSDKVSFSLMPAASAIRENGIRAQYDDFRRQAIARFALSSNPLPAEQILKSSMMSPAPPDILASLAPLAAVTASTFDNADKVVVADPYLDAWRSFALGLFALRRGELEEALAWCERSQTYEDDNPARKVSVLAVRAMALTKLGQSEGARKLTDECWDVVEDRFSRPLNAYEPSPRTLWFDWINSRILLREATSMLNEQLSPIPVPASP